MLNANPPTGRRVALVTVLTLVGLCVAVVCGLAIGPTPIGTMRIIGSIFSHVGIGHSTLNSLQSTIIWQLRAPRLVLGLLAGAMLSVAGGTYQGVFRNPLADPYLLGVAAGAGLGATFAIMDIGGGTYTPSWTP
jgi:iron complex transport system permease protein